MNSNSVEIQEVKIDPDNAGFGTGASDIVIPKTSSIFGKSSNVSLLSDMKDEVTPQESTISSAGQSTLSALSDLPESDIKPTAAVSLVEELKEKTAEEEGEVTEDSPKSQHKPGKDTMVNYLKEKIESGEFEAYEDYDESQSLEDYLYNLSDKDRTKLLDSNQEAKREKEREELRKEVFESLPGSLQYAAAAVAQGATEHDLQDIYAALLRVEQTRALDITNENDQEAIAYSYLQATGYMKGDPKKIQEQVEEWKNEGKLEGKVKIFKPELDQMSEQQVQYQLQQQEEYNRQQAELQQYYTQSIYSTLKKGEIGGLKLDKRKQQEFYEGLTNVKTSPLSGKPVNSLGARLEEIQFSDKPDWDLLMEANWLLTDKEGYRNALIQMGKNQAAIETEKKLKSAQQTGSKGAYEEPVKQSLPKKGITRQRNIFS